MGTLQSWRKAYGALKDSTKVGLAHVNSDFADLDVAIVKATNHVECPPKERHLRKILLATSAVRPRADVAYCIHALSRRLTKTHNWTVALKTLIVIHRTLREGDPTFREEFLNYSQRAHILQLSNFKDDSSPVAWDCSAWVRTYALFLEERLECFRVIRYDIEAERLPRPSQGQVQDKGYSKTRGLESEELLEHLPALQQLLYRLIGCRPEGAANHNYVIQYALALVLKESFKIYCAINDGIINLVDKFFEMPKHEAVKALDIYKRAGQQAGSLSDFYEVCKGLELARNFQFPVLREPPQSFLITMDEYIKEAPRVVTVPNEPLVEVDEDPAEVKTGEDGQTEKKKKTKTVVEGYWDWDLTNETQPILLRTPVTTDEYNAFYKKTFKEYLNPLASSHFTTEGEVEFRSFLYVPAASAMGKDDMVNPKTKNIRLYVKWVFISDDFDGELFPRCLSFVKGVVDSNDLPLNVSREILQESRIVRTMRKRLVRKAFDMILGISMSENLSFDTQAASSIEDSNALALAISPTDSGAAPTFNAGAAQSMDSLAIASAHIVIS